MEAELDIMELLLYDFAPFISVAIAVNLVSSFWDGVKYKAVNNLNNETNGFVQELTGIYTTKCSNSGLVSELQDESERYKVRLIRLSHIATFLGILIVIILFALLIKIGFQPKYTISTAEAWVIVGASLVPSTLFRVLGTIFSRRYVDKLKSSSSRMKSTAATVLKENLQTEYEQNKARI